MTAIGIVLLVIGTLTYLAGWTARAVAEPTPARVPDKPQSGTPRHAAAWRRIGHRTDRRRS